MMERDHHRTSDYIPRFLLGILVLISGVVGSATPAFGQQEARHFEKVVEHRLSLDYLISFPEGYSEDGAVVPLVLFLHGAGERGSDLDEESERMVEIIRSRGGERIKLTVHEGAGHDSWTQTYDDPAVWEWLFSQRRDR